MSARVKPDLRRASSAKDMLLADDEISMVLVCGGYRNCDLIDYTDKDLSFMYDLACGGGAILLKKGYGKNLVFFRQSSAASAPISWVPSQGSPEGTNFSTMPSLLITASSLHTPWVASEISFAVTAPNSRGRFLPAPQPGNL